MLSAAYFRFRKRVYVMRNFCFVDGGADNGANLRQLVEVDAGPNGDVEVAIVRKMIELIRKHQPGDFSWDSPPGSRYSVPY